MTYHLSPDSPLHLRRIDLSLLPNHPTPMFLNPLCLRFPKSLDLLPRLCFPKFPNLNLSRYPFGLGDVLASHSASDVVLSTIKRECRDHVRCFYCGDLRHERSFCKSKPKSAVATHPERRICPALSPPNDDYFVTNFISPFWHCDQRSVCFLILST